MESEKGESSSMQFENRKRDPANISGEWRLATVEEVTNDLHMIKQKGILQSVDTARLLDGWVAGTSGRYNISSEYKTGMTDMIVVKTKVSRPSDNSCCEEMYSEISSTPKGRRVALLLSCDDKIAEVLVWVLRNVENQTQLDGLKKSMDETFGNGRTILHYAADHKVNEEHGFSIAKLLMDEPRFEYGKELVRVKDKYGRTALHFAAFHGHIELCKFLIGKGMLKMDEEDQKGENPFTFAVNGNREDIVNRLLQLIYPLGEEMVQYIVFSRDAKGKTALHKAAAKGNIKMMEVLLGCTSGNELKKDHIRKSDWFRETALHEAARGGHTEAVKYLLRQGSLPLVERNHDDKTALHYAVQLDDVKMAKEVAEILLDHLQSGEEKTLLLWAAATGVGTAEESVHGEVREFLQTEKRDAAAGSSNNLLRVAVERGLENTAWDLITRGGDIQQLMDDMSWRNSLNSEQQQHLDNLWQHIEVMPDLGRDQPTGDDSLGRNHFAEGLASLFLNPFVKTPITVGIFGDWGMGKSSLMVQTEIALLKAAAQLAFPNLLQIEKFPGFKEWKLSEHGQRKFEKIRKVVKHLLVRRTSIAVKEDDDPLIRLLETYQPQYHNVYRSLAVMDRSEMFSVIGGTSRSHTKVDRLRQIPAILTVQYNAWHYQNELEAWAGLAVEITKVIEETMNTAQTIRTCFRYSWSEQQGKVCFVLILPCLLMSFIAGWIAWAAWLLISRSNHKDLVRLKYGFIPVTALTIVWAVIRQLFSVMKPISRQIMAYMRLPDHTGNLGYQQKVISDIKFLKAQIGEKPSWLWKFIAGQWWWNWFGIYSDTVKGTRIPKLPPASMDDLRIIVFVDDLDRCEDTVILQVLSAINLVLAACEINVILGMDKKMIAKAIANKFQHSNDKAEYTLDLANKYISKIVQLPLALPDPNEGETTNFLLRQLGVVLETDDDNIDSDEEEADVMTVLAGQSWPAAETEKGRSQEAIDSDAEEEEDVDKRRPMTCQPPSALSDDACHIAVNFSQSGQQEQRERPRGFFSTFWVKVSRLLEPRRALRNCLAQLQQSNGTPSSKRLQGVAINSVLLMSKYYSPGEREALSYLRQYASDERKLPREWKRFLNYHRLAWNILCKSGHVKSLANWQTQLVTWIFCCWQWRDQMNTIIEKWQELSSTQDDPSLSNIVERYDPSLSNIVERYTKMKYSEGEKDELYNQWMKLKQALGTLDVSMDCILAFQKFRLHCEVGHIERPFHLHDI